MEQETQRIPAEVLQGRTILGHPAGLYVLFFTEMWERFSYYGMRALLILFMTASVRNGGLGFPVAKAGAIYGLYTAMVYLLSLPGGWVADHITGQRRAVPVSYTHLPRLYNLRRHPTSSINPCPPWFQTSALSGEPSRTRRPEMPLH